ncbi:hypothetical protein OKW50_008214 [Paraburkholderia youngii]
MWRNVPEARHDDMRRSSDAWAARNAAESGRSMRETPACHAHHETRTSGVRACRSAGGWFSARLFTRVAALTKTCFTCTSSRMSAFAAAYRQMTVLPPIGKQSRYLRLQVTVLHAQERDPPAGRARIEWKLITNLPVRSRAEAIQKLVRHAPQRPRSAPSCAPLSGSLSSVVTLRAPATLRRAIPLCGARCDV